MSLRTTYLRSVVSPWISPFAGQRYYTTSHISKFFLHKYLIKKIYVLCWMALFAPSINNSHVFFSVFGQNRVVILLECDRVCSGVKGALIR